MVRCKKLVRNWLKFSLACGLMVCLLNIFHFHVNLYTQYSQLRQSEDYAVFNSKCRIRNIDPWNNTVSKYFQGHNRPTPCADRPNVQITYTVDNSLLINKTLWNALGVVSCCFRNIRRRSDEISIFSKRCKPLILNGFSVKLTTEAEYIKVVCRAKSANFVNYHFFVKQKGDESENIRRADLYLNIIDRYNVLIVGIDSMSRLNAKRQLPRTQDTFRRLYSGVEFFGYTKVGDNTFPNLVPLLTGLTEEELIETCWFDGDTNFDSCPWIWKLFKDKGYRTLFGEDSPPMSTFNFGRKGFKDQPTDYYIRTMLGPMYAQLNVSFDQICLQNKPVQEVTLKWVKEFVKKYKSDPFFAFSWSNFPFHGNIDSGADVDRFYAQFLEDVHKYVKRDTFVFLVSDHGFRWGNFRRTPLGILEDRLPLLMVSPPEKFIQNYPTLYRALVDNSRQLVTPFEVHETLEEILLLSSAHPWKYSANDRQGHSLFYNSFGDRGCLEAGVRTHWCPCHEPVRIPITADKVDKMGELIVNKINEKLIGHGNVCVKHEFKKHEEALVRNVVETNSEGKKTSYEVFSVTVETSPGDFKFEGTLLPKVCPENEAHLHSLGCYEVSEDISRVDFYGNLSWCVRDPLLKKYCYCKETFMANVTRPKVSFQEEEEVEEKDEPKEKEEVEEKDEPKEKEEPEVIENEVEDEDKEEGDSFQERREEYEGELIADQDDNDNEGKGLVYYNGNDGL